MTWAYVAVGAALGAPLRFLVAHRLDRAQPWGTVLVNVSGSFLLGLVTALSLDDRAVALLGTGFCGAFTTYSAFAVQTHARGVRDGAVTVLLTLPPALAAGALGFWLAFG